MLLSCTSCSIPQLSNWSSHSMLCSCDRLTKIYAIICKLSSKHGCHSKPDMLTVAVTIGPSDRPSTFKSLKCTFRLLQSSFRKTLASVSNEYSLLIQIRQRYVLTLLQMAFSEKWLLTHALLMSMLHALNSLHHSSHLILIKLLGVVPLSVHSLVF